MTEIVKSRKERLRACERALAEHMEEFVRVGLALKEIRDDKLYQEDEFKTFEAYCKARWEISRGRAYQLIDSSEIRLGLPDLSNKFDSEGPGGWKERQVAEFKRLGSPTRAKAVAARVIKEVEKSDGTVKLTAALVRKHVDIALGVKRGAKKETDEDKPELREVLYQYTQEVKGMAVVLEGTPGDAVCQHPETVEGFIEELQRLLTLLRSHQEAARPKMRVVEAH